MSVGMECQRCWTAHAYVEINEPFLKKAGHGTGSLQAVYTSQLASYTQSRPCALVKLQIVYMNHTNIFSCVSFTADITEGR